MKKTLFFTILLALSIGAYGQAVHKSGEIVGNPYRSDGTTLNINSNIVTQDSLVTDDPDAPTTVAIYSNGTQLTFDNPDGSEDTGVAAKDSTGNAPGNYMTRQNYHNDPTRNFKEKAYKALSGQTYLFPLAGNGNFATAATLSDGYAYYGLYYVPETITVDSVSFALTTAGEYTADNYNGIALYSLSGNILTRIDSTADDGNIWKTTAATRGVKPLVVGSTLTGGSYYYYCLVYNQSATSIAPQIAGETFSSVLSGYVVGTVKKVIGYKTSTANSPVSINMSAIASGTSVFGIVFH